MRRTTLKAFTILHVLIGAVMVLAGAYLALSEVPYRLYWPFGDALPGRLEMVLLGLAVAIPGFLIVRASLRSEPE